MKSLSKYLTESTAPTTPKFYPPDRRGNIFHEEVIDALEAKNINLSMSARIGHIIGQYIDSYIIYQGNQIWVANKRKGIINIQNPVTVTEENRKNWIQNKVIELMKTK